jgi:cytochrome c5
MPRLAVSDHEAKLIAQYLVPEPSKKKPELQPEWVESGRALYRRNRCADCHAFSGSGMPLHAQSPYLRRRSKRGDQPLAPMALAPDLRFARQRLQPSAVVRWLMDPSALRPDTLMPKFNLSERDAQRLAAFVLLTPLAPPSERPPVHRLPVLERKVTHAEVEKRVFKKVCWHCHSSAALALGDGGPGNTGGFGFAPRGLDLSSYRSIASGLVDARGSRQSVFARNDAGVPFLVAALMARHEEVAGRPVPGVRGMPLGLPPLPVEDIQLVESWIAQGRPR